MSSFEKDHPVSEVMKPADMYSQDDTVFEGADLVEKKEKSPAENEAKGQDANDMTCAICLDQIIVEDLCMIKGCDHVYCGKCILVWASQKDPCWCPQCKAPFTSLLTYRKLDGTLAEFPTEESVCLLKRTHWFEAYLKELEKGKAALNLAPVPLTADDARDWVDWQEEQVTREYRRYEEEFDDDDEVEAYYFSSAAGRARIFGNRRFGENGYIASGRMQARPVQPARTAQKSKGKGKAQAGAASSAGGHTQHHASHKTVGGTPRGAATACDFGSPAPGSSRAGSSSDGTPGSSGGRQGRRARRKEKQASADARARLLASP